MSGNVLDCRVRYDGEEGGHTETKNGQIRQHKTTAKVAAACGMSTRQPSEGLRLSIKPSA